MDIATIIQVVVAVSGAIIAAFVAGYTIFFPLGKSIGENKGVSTIRDREATIASQNVSLATVADELRVAKDEVISLRAQLNAPPTKDESDGLNALLERNEDEVWLEFPSTRLPAHDEFVATTKCPIVSIVNLKGGVAKTTIAANLAAYFDSIGKNVLLIDADFQGSLSDNLLQLSQADESTAKVDEWLASEMEPDVLLRTVNRVGARLPNTSFVTAFYSLASIETKLMMRWLLESLRQTSPADIRYALSRVLHSSAALNRFNVILIDCPPRLSAATVAGLCASSHIIVPTNADRKAAETVPNFTQMTQRLMAELNPNIRLAGVVPTMTYQRKLSREEKLVIEDVEEDATHIGNKKPKILPHIPWKKPIKDMGSAQIAYLDANEDVKLIYKALGESVAAQIGL